MAEPAKKVCFLYIAQTHQILHSLSIAIELARNWPSITKTKAPLAEAEEWKDTTDKLQYLQR